MTIDDQDPTEDAKDGSVIVVDSLVELAEYRNVLLQPAALLDPEELLEQGVLVEPEQTERERCDQEERLRLGGLVKIASRLQAVTGWTREQLLESIGCKESNATELAKDPERTARCTMFLTTLLDAAGRVDSARSCQAVVRRCARLSNGLDVERFQQALNVGEPSALDYISLGELSTAMRVARIAAGKQEPARTFGPSPYDSAPVVHLSTPRVDLYVQGKRDVLGERVYVSMAAHIESCSACEEAAEARRLLIIPD